MVMYHWGGIQQPHPMFPGSLALLWIIPPVAATGDRWLLSPLFFSGCCVLCVDFSFVRKKEPSAAGKAFRELRNCFVIKQVENSSC